eukprot:1276577-Alexandrium_andersonii.AAC.1
MGPAGPGFWRIAARQGGGPLDACRAILFADQSGAFERVGLPWLRLVFERWGMPDWIVRCLWALVSDRAGCAAGESSLGPRRGLAR